MATSLGIHLRADGFSFALLEGSAKKHSLKAVGMGRFQAAADHPKALGKLLAAAIKLRKADHLTIAVPSSRVVLREMSLPFQEREKVLQVLKFEVESELYHLAVEDVIADFIALEAERATPSLLVGVMPKKHVAQAIEVAAGAGWDPHVVDASYGAFASALTVIAPKIAVPPEAEGAPAAPLAFMHLGPDETLLAIVGPTGRLRAARSLPIGWLEMLRDLERPKPEAAAAQEGKEGAAPAPASDAAAENPASEDTAAAEALFGGAADLDRDVDLGQALELAGSHRVQALCQRLASEVRRGLAAMPGGATAIHLTGETLPGLEEALTARTGLPAGPLHEGRELLGGKEADWVAVGAALEGLGVAAAPMNFRQEEHRYAHGLERVEGPLTLALVGLIAWLVIDAGVHLKTGVETKRKADTIYVAANKRVDELNRRVREDDDYPDDWVIKNDLSGTDVSTQNRILVLDARVKGAVKQLDELMGQSDLEMPPSCLEAWRLLMDFLEKELKDYPDKWMVESFDFTSVDRGRAGSGAVPHVEAKFGLTLKSDDAARIAATFDRIDRGLREQPWCVDSPTIPTTDAAKVGPGKTAVVTVKIATGSAVKEVKQ